MKYKLKKDLPFAKAGAEVRKNDYLNSDAQTCFACGVYSFWVRKEVMDEWIEEVKPRDYFISLKQDSEGKWWLNDVAEHREDLRDGGVYKIIKVREVIE